MVLSSALLLVAVTPLALEALNTVQADPAVELDSAIRRASHLRSASSFSTAASFRGYLAMGRITPSAATSASRTIPKVVWTYWDDSTSFHNVLSRAKEYIRFVSKASVMRDAFPTLQSNILVRVATNLQTMANTVAYAFGGTSPWLALCRKSFHELNPDYEIRVLDRESVWDWLNSSDIGLGARHLEIQHFTDAARLALLSKYGGIWLDASLLLLKPLDAILRNGRPFFVFDVGGSFSVENWFLASAPGDPLITQVRRCWTEFMKGDYASFESSGMFSQKQVDMIRSTGLAQFGTYLAMHACFLKSYDEQPTLWLQERLINATEAAFAVQASAGWSPSKTIGKPPDDDWLKPLLGERDAQLVASASSETSLLLKVQGHGGNLNGFTRGELQNRQHSLKDILERSSLLS